MAYFFIPLAVAQQRITAKHPQIKLVGTYASATTAFEVCCLACSHHWITTLNRLEWAKGCPRCVENGRGASISLARLNSPVKLARWRSEIEAVCATHQLIWWNPEEFVIAQATYGEATLEFECRPCGYAWWSTVRAIRLNAGCPLCADRRRLTASSKTRLLSTEAINAQLSRWSHGYTRLVGKWRGEGQDRTYACRCGRQWQVKSGTRINLQVCCKLCITTSGHSLIAIVWLEREAKRRRIKIQHARNGGEFRVPNTRFRVDGYNARTRTVFEFYGDAYHGNPRCYAPTDIPNPFSTATARELQLEVKQRERQLRKLGYVVVSIWEHDFRQQLAQTPV